MSDGGGDGCDDDDGDGVCDAYILDMMMSMSVHKGRSKQEKGASNKGEGEEQEQGTAHCSTEKTEITEIIVGFMECVHVCVECDVDVDANDVGDIPSNHLSCCECVQRWDVCLSVLLLILCYGMR